MTGPTNNLKLRNQFGEVSMNELLDSDEDLSPPIGAHSLYANNTGSTARAVATTFAALAIALPAKTVAAYSFYANNTASADVPLATTFAAFADFVPTKTIAAHSILLNDTGSAARMIEKTTQQLANLMPSKAGVNSITAIAVPSTATAEDCANKINEILAALKVVS